MARKKVKTEQQRETERILYDAREALPYSEFVRSCAEFYKTRGFLTPRQLEALQNLPEDGSYEYDGFDPSDLYD